MMDLKYFYIVEINVTHPAIIGFSISKEFSDMEWITLTSQPYDDPNKCTKDCMKLMKAKTKQFKKALFKVKCSFAENPHLNCREEDVDSIDTSDFDENALVSIKIEDKKDRWLMQAAVMVFGMDSSEAIANRRLH